MASYIMLFCMDIQNLIEFPALVNPQLVSSFSVTSILSNLGQAIVSKEAAALAAIAGTFLAFYRYVYLRPELLLSAENLVSYETVSGETSSQINLYLSNVGHEFAEDTYLSFALKRFEFDDVDFQTPESPLLIKSHEMVGFFGMKGERHDLYIENALYEGDIFKLYFGGCAFENDGKYTLKYTVACKSHGPRKGKIVFTVEDGEVEINHKYPTKLRRIRNLIGWSPPKDPRTTDIS
ncbi:hypothetical protein [Halorubrum ezzemoulense]|uniref:hypothetical protein n=1 Tax=Halorubrum ezzemoulense TaxID=337243 RepID=UPI00232CF015|nr:hypothetical protein [Halorubrum ezzemoulense]MDB2242661.1 hypothetical protein [Halorubrum ezzemoulense]